MKNHPRIGLLVMTLVGLSVWSYFRLKDKADATAEAATSPQKEASRPALAPETQRQNPRVVERKSRQDELREQFAEAMRDKSPARRKEKTRAYIEELCSMGLTEVAWTLIDGNAGSAREAQLEAFFRHAKLPLEEILEKAKALDLQGEASDALRARAEGLTPSELEDMLRSETLARFLTDKADQEDIITGDWLGKALLSHFMQRRHDTDPSALNEFVSILEKQASSGYLSGEVAVQAIGNAPLPVEQKWKMLAQMPTREQSTGSNTIRQLLLLQMISNDAKKTMETIRQGPPASVAEDVYRATRRWLHSAPQAAEEWYRKEEASLNPTEKSSILRAYSELALEANDLPGAESLAKQIPDETVKQKVFEQLQELSRKNATPETGPSR